MAPKKIPKRFTRRWVRDNPDFFRELSTPPEECPVCLQKIQRPCSPILGDYPTSCRHFCCRECWLELLSRGPAHWKCPVCREPLAQWIGSLFGAQVKLERFDRHAVRVFVHCAMHQIFRTPGLPMDPLLETNFRSLGEHILADAVSSDDD